jgi:hypothetical protein
MSKSLLSCSILGDVAFFRNISDHATVCALLCLWKYLFVFYSTQIHTAAIILSHKNRVAMYLVLKT